MTENISIAKECHRCGFTGANFHSTLRLGCSACYQVFAAELETFLPKMHPSLEHLGKVPERARRAQLHHELEEVESLLRQGLPEKSDALLEQWKQIAIQIEGEANS